ncbi:MAG: hypothetical protein O3C57_03870, partial [Verrucomicrobia bacterium]|nr:hypothetical protein [Verrucomicrobiota bacterium]
CVCHRLISRHFLCDEFGARINSDAPRPSASEYVYSRALDFFLSIRATFGGKSSRTEFDVTRHYADARLLVIDELQERGETTFEDRLLANVIDKRYAASLPTILIANIEANEFPSYVGASISDRLNETGGLIECGWGSFRG